MPRTPTGSSLQIQALFVALGGALGAFTRYGLTEILVLPSFPIATIAVNLSGSFALGILTGAFSTQRQPAWLKGGVITGFLGSYTTTSAFASDFILLSVADQSLRISLLYGFTAIFGGLSLAALGFIAGKRIGRIREALS